MEEVLQAGTIIDKYGSSRTGKFFSPEGTPYEERALHYLWKINHIQSIKC